ncbi:MAG TPA: uroporphyrinogen decarboxylase family protein [Dehalococcoidales bacterium]|nr:uroporphyrinogen decarboxylase family protein [Dehalococcoidales bacterium]
MSENMAIISPANPVEWAKLTPAQKRAARFAGSLAAAEHIPFVNAEAKAAYKMRLKRQIDAYNVEEPDRVPVSINIDAMPMYEFGLDYNTGIHDYDKMRQAYNAFNDKYAKVLEYYASPPIMFPAKVYEILDYKLYAWPGHGLALNGEGYQFVEGEYMKASEYDDFIRDPSDFWIRTYLPRCFGAFEPFRMFGSATTIIESVAGIAMIPLATPQMQATLAKLMEAGKELGKLLMLVGEFAGRGAALGYPGFSFVFGKAPFDTLGDTLRGTQGIMKDMYRQPDKLLKAIDMVTEITINTLVSQANSTGAQIAMFPLHKGADGWMSQKQFDTFYWPSLKRILNALHNEGIMAVCFAEGAFNTRLDSINEFPKGSVCWYFDQTDMARAKKVLGEKCCIMGNVPSSLLLTSTPAQVKKYCRNLIEVCGKGGGYILASGSAGIDRAKIPNLRAMVEAANAYGYYKK